MPNEDDLKSGADDSAGKKSDTDGDAAGKKAGSDKGKGSGSDDDDDGDAGGETPKPITFKSQAELDRVIQRRVDRATKDANDKAQLSKEQLLEKERDDALGLVRERDLKDDFNAAATTAGLDASKAGKFFRMYRDDIETDDKGKPTNLKDVVKQVKADFPELFKPPVKGGGDGGRGNGDDGKAIDGNMNNALRRMAGRG